MADFRYDRAPKYSKIMGQFSQLSFYSNFILR